MKSTALGAENIIFISDAHEKFYYEKLQEVRYQDVYHKALCYCLGINGDTRKNADRIYNFKTGSVKTKCLHEGWQTSGSLKVVRMAFNLYCNSTPSVWDYEDAEEQVNECRQYRMTNIVNSTLPTQNNHSEKNKPDGVFVIKQGKTNYKVKVFFDHSSGLTAEDRLKRIIQAEAERESA